MRSPSPDPHLASLSLPLPSQANQAFPSPPPGPSGYITPDLVKSHAAKAATDAGDKVKVFVCGPPGQVAAIAGPKDGGKQGPVGGALKELGYEAGQVFKF